MNRPGFDGGSFVRFFAAELGSPKRRQWVPELHRRRVVTGLVEAPVGVFRPGRAGQPVVVRRYGEAPQPPLPLEGAQPAGRRSSGSGSLVRLPYRKGPWLFSRSRSTVRRLITRRSLAFSSRISVVVTSRSSRSTRSWRTQVPSVYSRRQALGPGPRSCGAGSMTRYAASRQNPFQYPPRRLVGSACFSAKGGKVMASLLARDGTEA